MECAFDGVFICVYMFECVVAHRWAAVRGKAIVSVRMYVYEDMAQKCVILERNKNTHTHVPTGSCIQLL